jgi:hypothetical protein
MNEPYKEFDKLLKGFIEGSLNRQEQQVFEEALKADSDARERYLDYTAVDSMLANQTVVMDNFQKRQMKIDSSKRRVEKQALKKRLGTPLLLLAASIFLAFGLGYYLLKQTNNIAHLEKFSGNINVIINGDSVKAVKDMPLQNGARIICDNNSQARIRTTDGSLFKIAPSSKVVISLSDGQYLLDLQQGFIDADVNKQKAGKPLLISTPKGNLTVLGTVLRVSVTEKTTMLIVDEGSVEIKNSQNQKVIVNTDEATVAQDNKGLELRSLKKYKVDSLEIISALYGTEDKWLDVTSPLRLRAINCRLIPLGQFVTVFGDPFYGKPKSLKIEYKIDGKKGFVVISEYKRGHVDYRNFATEIILPEI